MQFLDKNAIGTAAILGFLGDNNLTNDQFNNLQTFFYLGLLISQLPHALAFQHLPVAKYMSVMIFFWAVFVALHCVAHSYYPLRQYLTLVYFTCVLTLPSPVVLRILLGIAEGCITPGIMVINQMFYTRLEMAERMGWSFACNGIAQIFAGFISYGVAWAPVKTPTNGVKINQWQIYMIIVSGLTLGASILFATLFPDSPTRTKFLTEEEKLIVVKRMRSNQSGMETKVFKSQQCVQALNWVHVMYTNGFL